MEVISPNTPVQSRNRLEPRRQDYQQIIEVQEPNPTQRMGFAVFLVCLVINTGGVIAYAWGYENIGYAMLLLETYNYFTCTAKDCLIHLIGVAITLCTLIAFYWKYTTLGILIFFTLPAGYFLNLAGERMKRNGGFEYLRATRCFRALGISQMLPIPQLTYQEAQTILEELLHSREISQQSSGQPSEGQQIHGSSPADTSLVESSLPEPPSAETSLLEPPKEEAPLSGPPNEDVKLSVPLFEEAPAKML